MALLGERWKVLFFPSITSIGCGQNLPQNTGWSRRKSKISAFAPFGQKCPLCTQSRKLSIDLNVNNAGMNLKSWVQGPLLLWPWAELASLYSSPKCRWSLSWLDLCDCSNMDSQGPLLEVWLNTCFACTVIYIISSFHLQKFSLEGNSLSDPKWKKWVLFAVNRKQP